ncbi:MAG: tetratricopeptide repeat protein [Desulfatibacillaceae bacterium]
MNTIPKRLLAALLTLMLAFALAGCGDGAEDLYQTAKLEELQNNEAHARELYQAILDRHPDSPYAEQARERLAELGRNAGQ